MTSDPTVQVLRVQGWGRVGAGVLELADTRSLQPTAKASAVTLTMGNRLLAPQTWQIGLLLWLLCPLETCLLTSPQHAAGAAAISPLLPPTPRSVTNMDTSNPLQFI